MALCINREFSLQLQGITLCNYRYLYSAANTPILVDLEAKNLTCSKVRNVQGKMQSSLFSVNKNEAHKVTMPIGKLRESLSKPKI